MTNSASAETIGTAAEAERVIDSLNAIMDRLIETVEAETAHMRKGRVRDALAAGRAGLLPVLRFLHDPLG